jgi:hypothetical protein
MNRNYYWSADGWQNITADGYPHRLDSWTADGWISPYFLTVPRGWYKTRRSGRRR